MKYKKDRYLDKWWMLQWKKHTDLMEDMKEKVMNGEIARTLYGHRSCLYTSGYSARVTWK